MMVKMEIGSFIFRCKSLLLSGRNATLLIKSDAGKAEVNLTVELPDVSLPEHLQHRRGPRNGPSRERRKLRRAAAAKEAEKATEIEASIGNEDTAEEEVTEGATNPEKGKVNTSAKNKTLEGVESETLKDEFCSNESFEITSSEELVDKILVTADCQADWNDSVVTKLINEKLNMIGIKMKSISVNRNSRRCFESCVVAIQPMQRKLILKESFPLRRWTLECVM